MDLDLDGDVGLDVYAGATIAVAHSTLIRPDARVDSCCCTKSCLLYTHVSLGTSSFYDFFLDLPPLPNSAENEVS